MGCPTNWCSMISRHWSSMWWTKTCPWCAAPCAARCVTCAPGSANTACARLGCVRWHMTSAARAGRGRWIGADARLHAGRDRPQARARRSNAWRSTTPHPSLPNRRLLLDRLQRLVLSSQRTHQHGARCSSTWTTWDLNDTLGHDMGDQLLTQVATRLVPACANATPSRALAATNSSSCSKAWTPDDQAARQAEAVAANCSWPSTPRSSWQTSSTTAPPASA